MKKKGFTLIELLGVVVILGIIIALAVVSYSNYLDSTKKKAFNVEEINFMDAARSAYADCLTNDPNNEFCNYHKNFDTKYEYQFVYLTELVDNSYIREIKDPYDTSEFCNLEKSYVYVSRKNSTQSNNVDMVYKTCLICGDHKSEECLNEDVDYSTFESTCTAYYDAVGGPKYDGEWTDRNVYLSFGASGNYRYGIDEFEYTVGGTGDTKIDANSNDSATLTLNKTVNSKEYKVQAFDGMNGTGTITSCGNIKIDKGTIDNVSITAKTASGTTVKSDSWVMEKVTLSANVSPSSSTSGYLYQWYKDGEKYGDQTTASTLTVQDKGTYKVEVTNKVGKIVKISNEFIVKVDTKKPTCVLAASGNKTNGVYTSNVSISFESVSDIETGSTEGSGVVKQVIDVTTLSDNVKDKVITGTVTDGVGRTNTCTIKVTKDDKVPTLKIVASDSIASGSWHKADFKITASGADNVSGNTYYHGTSSNPTTVGNTDTISNNTAGTTYYYKVCSGAGLCTSGSYSAKLDETTPILNVAASDGIASGSWHKANFTITASGANNISGNTYYHGTSSNPTTVGNTDTVSSNTTASGTTYYYKVCSGSGLCTTKNYSAKLDKSTPTIIATATNNNINTSTNTPLSNYVTVTPGISGQTTVCKVGNTVVTNTNQLAFGVNTVVCTTTGGNSNASSVTMTFKHQYSATYACSGGRTLSGSNCVYNYTNNEAQCGCAAYKSCQNSVCGVASYKSCSNSACGYNSCSNSACGYNSCATSGCGAKTCQNAACGYNTCTNSACGYKSCTYVASATGMVTAAKCKASCSYTCENATCVQYVTGKSSKCGYASCATSGCGAKTCQNAACGYNTCANSACGSKTCTTSACGNKTCSTSACGVASYNSCATSACGCQTANSCTKTENTYRYYTCAQTGKNGNTGATISATLSGTTCSF